MNKCLLLCCETSTIVSYICWTIQSYNEIEGRMLKGCCFFILHHLLSMTYKLNVYLVCFIQEAFHILTFQYAYSWQCLQTPSDRMTKLYNPRGWLGKNSNLNLMKSFELKNFTIFILIFNVYMYRSCSWNIVYTYDQETYQWRLFVWCWFVESQQTSENLVVCWC